MNASLIKEWGELMARRCKYNTSGQDGSDFATWARFRGAMQEPVQMELFA